MARSNYFLIPVLACAALLCGCAAQSKREAAPESANEGGLSKEWSQLLAAYDLLNQGKPEQALASVNELVEEFNRMSAGDTRRQYSARTLPESLMYMLEAAAEEKQSAVVVSDVWVMVLYARAYVLVELGDLASAKHTLQNARSLAPLNSLVLSELAHIFQSEKDWRQALELYGEAVSGAEFSPESEKIKEKSRALRGQGFTLIELGRLDEARAKFEQCLELNPNDAAARNELIYIIELEDRAE